MEKLIDWFDLEKPVTETVLRKMDVKRLLAYYKSWRTKTGKFEDSWRCECCGDFLIRIYPQDYTPEKLKHIEHQTLTYNIYLKYIKSILNTKEHVAKNNP